MINMIMLLIKQKIRTGKRFPQIVTIETDDPSGGTWSVGGQSFPRKRDHFLANNMFIFPSIG